MTIQQLQCAWDALKYSRDHESRSRGYESYEKLHALYRTNPCVDSQYRLHFLEVEKQVEPLFNLWLEPIGYPCEY